MKEKHPIDSFFKDKLANRQYPMKEEYWASASTLIEANAARKRRRFLWFFLFLGLLSGTSLIGYFAYQNNYGTPVEMAQDVPTHAREGKSLYAENRPEAKASKGTASEVLESAMKHLPTPTQKNKNLTKLEPEKTLKKNPSRADISFATKHTKQVNSDSERIDEKTHAEAIFLQKEAETVGSIHKEILEEKLQGEKNVEEKALKEETLENELTSTDLNKRVLGVDGQELGEESSLEETGLLGNAQITDTKQHRVAAQFLSEKNVYLSDMALSQNQAFVPPFLGMNRRHSLGLAFGFALHDAMGSKVEQEQSIGMTPIIGLGYRFQLNRNLSLLSGVRYTQTPSLAGDSTYLSTSFSFGSTVQGIRIRPLALHQVEVPLSLRWQAGTRSSIALGGYMRYLINVQSEVSRFETNPFETAPGPVNKAWGYKQGFETIDLGLQLGYYYQLSEGFHLGVEAQYGLRDLRGDGFYRETHFDRNLNARLVLRYDFWRF